ELVVTPGAACGGGFRCPALPRPRPGVRAVCLQYVLSCMNERRIASLDALRGLAALTVAISHYLVYRDLLAAHAEATSALGVEIFFTLSGFVLAPQIIRCGRDGSLATLRVFLVRRWMRTIPSYLVALTAVTILIGLIDPRDFARYSLYIQNLFGQHNRL